MKKNKELDFSSLQALYESLPKVNCKRLCYDTCGVITAWPAEFDLMQEKLGFRPKFLSSEEAVQLYQVPGDPLIPSNCRSCPYLNGATCTIHDARPMICRLYGIVPEMKCSWGCRAERFLTEEEAAQIFEFMRKLKPGRRTSG